EALSRGTMLLDCRFGNCGQAGVHRHRPCGFVSMGGGSRPSSYIADYLPIRQDVHLVSRKCLLRLTGGIERLVGFMRNQGMLLVGRHSLARSLQIVSVDVEFFLRGLARPQAPATGL